MWNISLIINTWGILLTAGLGAAVCIKSGEFNLGGEGQIYAGGFVCAIVLSILEEAAVPSALINTIAILAACLAGGLITLLSALLKKFKKTSFLLSSFIASSAIIPILDGLITGPFRQKEGNLLATPFIAQNFRFQTLFQTAPINLYFAFAIILAVLLSLFLNRSAFGKKICIYGIAPQYALYAGFPEIKISFFCSFLSGALHGLAGAAAVCGIYFTCHQGFYAGMGWNALAVSMIAFSKPALLIPVSLAMAVLLNITGNLVLFYNFDFDISGLLQAVIIFSVAVMRRDRNAS